MLGVYRLSAQGVIGVKVSLAAEPMGSAYAVVFSPDGKLIVCASRDNTVRLWDSATGAACHTLRGHLGWVIAVAFSPDGKLVASASWDSTIRLWDSATGAVGRYPLTSS
jgi:WD40 repeat protein